MARDEQSGVRKSLARRGYRLRGGRGLGPFQCTSGESMLDFTGDLFGCVLVQLDCILTGYIPAARLGNS